MMKTPSKNLLLQLLAGLGESVVLVDVARRPWRTVYFNPKLLHLLHAQAGDIAGQNAEKLLFRIAGNDAVEAVRSCGEDRPQVSFEGEYLRADQPSRLVTGRVLKLSGSDQLRAIIMRDADMSDADTAGATGTTISMLTLDTVTGMMQREAFLEVLQRDCAIAAREQAWIAILVLRIDAFDAYRGTFGQHASDSALKRVAAIIRLAVGSATVATMTAAGILLPIVQGSEVMPELMVLATGSGSLLFSHFNDIGFWMFKEYYNVSIKQTFAIWTVMESIVGLVGLGAALLLNWIL